MNEEARIGYAPVQYISSYHVLVYFKCARDGRVRERERDFLLDLE